LSKFAEQLTNSRIELIIGKIMTNQLDRRQNLKRLDVKVKDASAKKNNGYE